MLFSNTMKHVAGAMQVRAQNDPNINKVDNLGISHKIKIVNLTTEFVHDIKLKVHQADAIRKEMGKSFSFELGFTIGRMREKYRYMMELYRQMRDKFEKRANIYPPEIGEGLFPLHYVITMERVHQKELEIDYLIELLLRIPKSEFEKNKPNVAHKINNMQMVPGAGQSSAPGSGNGTSPPLTIPPGVSLPPMSPSPEGPSPDEDHRGPGPRVGPDYSDSGDTDVDPEGPGFRAYLTEQKAIQDEEKLKKQFRDEYNKRHDNAGN